MKNLTILILALCAFTGCSKSEKFETSWAKVFKTLGSSSSPQCTDLNRDGILDIVIGASKNEFEKSDSSVLALDGKTGAVLWSVFAMDQIVGSATFLDVNNDSIPEVFIGGRSAEFICINGKTGNVLWRFEKSESTPLFQCCLRFNFFNAQIIPDQSGDGIKDLLVSNGGNAKAKPSTEENRFPGVLAIFNSKTGELIAADTMPDGKETYMSPVVYDFEGKEDLQIIFGSGGETIGGHLFKIDLKSLLHNNITSAIVLASEQGHGFIAPPTLADVNTDGIKDIIVNWFGGKMMAIDGKSNSKLWERSVPNTEIYSTATPGYFNEDSIPDFFASFNKGAWPHNTGSLQRIINGKDGTVLYADSLGCLGYASSVTADLNHDGFDEAIWSVNEFECNPPSYIETDLTNDSHSLKLLDFHNHTLESILPPVKTKNISSTPWVGDLDGDNFLDIILCTQRNNLIVDQYSGIRIERIKTTIKITTAPTWGAYMGANGTGIFLQK